MGVKDAAYHPTVPMMTPTENDPAPTLTPPPTSYDNKNVSTHYASPLGAGSTQLRSLFVCVNVHGQSQVVMKVVRERRGWGSKQRLGYLVWVEDLEIICKPRPKA